MLDLFSAYTVLAGVAVVALFALHGATFLVLRTGGELCDAPPPRRDGSASRPRSSSRGFLAATVAVAVDRNDRDVLPAVVPAALGGAALVAVVLLVRGRRSGWAFVATALAAVLTVATIFTGLYPRVMVSHPNFANSLTISDAAAAHYALSVITVVGAVFLPVVLLYQGWTYHVFRARLSDRPSAGVESA